MSKNTFTREATCVETVTRPLTTEEHADRGVALARKVEALQRLDNEKKAWNADFKERRKKAEDETNKLKRIVADGVESVGINAYHSIDRENSEVRYYRCDNNELIRTSYLTRAQMQMTMDELWDDLSKTINAPSDTGF